MPSARKLWLSPALPIMVIVRVGTALGYPMKMLEFVAHKRFFQEKMPRSLRAYQPHERDVFIATFAKSGTNWAMQIAQQIAYRGRAEFEHIHDIVPWPEAPMPGIVSLSDDSVRRRSPTGWRVIKTHLPRELIPYSEKVQYVTVLRDPKEVVVSAYYFFVGGLGLLGRISFDEWYARWMQEDRLGTAWAEHTAGYWAWRDRPNVTVLSFGHMKADLPGTVQRFADVMGVSLTDEERAEVTRRAGFAYMKTCESQFAPPRFPLRGRSPMPLMMRRGRSGESGELLSHERQVALDRRSRSQLDRLGCDLPYDELFEPSDL